ncbi:MAG TPA: hypothetical protein DHW82_03980 [Spirochaetia bacterium]|nr:hypothetical protein [Spirochaetia bacterium]
MKKIPYGIANFEKIKENKQFYYVDKTNYIKEIEDLGSQYHFFLRPRRFGKSLFLSMLEHYYDLNRKNQFDELFGDTYIGQNPTPLKNSFPILKLNFSGVPTDRDLISVQSSFNLKIKGNIHSFYVFYPSLTGGESQFEKDFSNIKDATDILNEFIRLMFEKNIRYYLLIDEYDNFANNVLIHHGKDNYQALTHSGGFLRSFFAAIKNATETRTVERMFAIGVSPLVLSDVTSGMNIGDNISFDLPFHAMAGFSQNEVESMLDYYIEQKAVHKEDRQTIIDIFNQNYNHYSFSHLTEKTLYNSDMVLYFFNKYFKSNQIPDYFLDENVRIDYGKLRFLILESGKLNGNFNILSEIIENGETPCELVHSFALNEIIQKDKFKSFLYYLGLLTIKEHIYGSKFILSIPNEVIKTMHYDTIRASLSEGIKLNINVDFLKNEFDNLAFHGRWKSIFDHILEKLYEIASIRDFIQKEHGIKLFMLAYLNVSPLYFVESEPEMNKGYADIFLRKNTFTTDKTQHEYIVELKYLTQEDLKRENSIDMHRKEAIGQLEKYAVSKTITCTLHKIILICSAQEVLLLEEV